MLRDWLREKWNREDFERYAKMVNPNWPACRHGKLAERCEECIAMCSDPHCVRYLGARTCDRPRSSHPHVDCATFLCAGDAP